MIAHDVVIIGGGLAGLRAAVGLAQRWDVAVLSTVHPLRSHSGAAQGGINAAIGNAPDGRDDTPEKHAFDTVKGSDYLADQSAVALMCQRAPEAVYELEHWGAAFSRFSDGRIAQRPFGGAGYPRACYAADRTGHILLNTLYGRALRSGVTFHDEWTVTRLAVADGRFHGLIAYDLRRGRFETIAAKVCLLATGGYGRVFRNSTNALINTGSGIGIALKAGMAVKDMEFIQFHPTTLFGSNILITEGARGEGGHLLNRQGERFMERTASRMMELAPRDIVARSIQTEIDEGRGFEGGHVLLDLRHLGSATIHQRLPAIRQICIDFAGIDPIDAPIPIQPGQHYSMGGIDTDVTGRTQVDNVYAAGECACVSVHGANRLGGNSLLDTVVFGRLVAEDINRRADELQDAPSESVLHDHWKLHCGRVDRLFSRPRGVTHNPLRDALRQVCSEKVGIFRREADLSEAVDAIRALRQQYQQVRCRSAVAPFHYEILHVLELEAQLDLAWITAAGALARQESRGSHSRRDFPARDDLRWLKHTVARLVEGELTLDYTGVDTSHYVPSERTY